jgi:hypothetical protein
MNYFSRDRRLYRKLIAAIGRDDVERMKSLLDDGAPLTKPEGETEGMLPLSEAAHRGNVEGINLLISSGAKVDETLDGYGRTALQHAAFHQHKDAVSALQAAGADINAPMYYDKKTALHEAQDYQHAEMLEFLVKQGANVNAQDSNGRTVLHAAARAGRSEAVKFLLENGADATLADRQMNTAADLAQKDYPGLAEMIRKHGSEPKPADPAEGWQMTGDEEVARVTLKKGVGYRLTETFNFSSRLYTSIAQNVATGAESQFVRNFDELGEAAVTAAQAAYRSLGGKAAENTLEKKKLPAPGQGGA